jgi:ubiquinone/menaquinone biosynthesis C-methylase UbiE
MFARDWDSRVADAELIARSRGFRQLRDRILEIADPGPQDTVVDVGSGTGLLALAFAERAARVWAVDSSPAMTRYVGAKASSAGLDNIEPVLASAVCLPLVDRVADLVVSNYCLHELRNADKDRALAEAARVLKPGGRLVIGDMMFSLNPMHPRDRRIVTSKLRQLASRGVPGVWRLLKNGARLLSGRWEYPANAIWWQEALKRTGFDRVSIEMLPHEGGIAVARAPSAAVHGSASSVAAPGTLPSADNRLRAVDLRSR